MSFNRAAFKLYEFNIFLNDDAGDIHCMRFKIRRRASVNNKKRINKKEQHTKPINQSPLFNCTARSDKVDLK